MMKFLFKDERHPWIAYSVSMALGIFYVFYMYPLTFLLGEGAFFSEGDAAQHVSGWLFFAKDSWRFPLLFTERLNYPEGVSIVFTDSIPLAALLFKPFVRWLPEGFHYIGLWHAVAYLTQAIAATFTIRSLGGRTVFAAIVATVFALMWPVLTWRLGHTALMTHSLIIFAIGFYFFGIRGELSDKKAYGNLAFLGVLALLIHAYLWAMTTCVLFAFLIDDGFRNQHWKQGLWRAIGYVAGCGFLMVVFGYFMSASSPGDYGAYTLNFASPFIGGSLNPFFASIERKVTTTGEGFVYFGLGFIVLLGVLLVSNICIQGREVGHRMCSWCKPYRGLMLILILTTLFAASNHIRLGVWTLVEIPLPQMVCELASTFRAGVRFFWLPSYVILFSTLAYFLRKCSFKYGILLVLAMSLQWEDCLDLRNHIKEATHEPAGQDAFLESIVSRFNSVYLYPAYPCGNVFGNDSFYLQFQYAASKAGVLLNAGYVARAGTNPAWCRLKNQVFSQPLQDGSLYVAERGVLEYSFKTPQLFIDAIKNGHCVEDDGTLFCAKKEWVELLKEKYALKSAKLGNILVPRKEFDASMLFVTPVGERTRDGIIRPKELDGHGTLSFGPYANLPKGKYRIEIEYSSPSTPDVVVGKWDIAAERGRRIISNGLLMGTGGAFVDVAYDLDLHENADLIEVRTFYEGREGLALKSITITKLDG